MFSSSSFGQNIGIDWALYNVHVSINKRTGDDDKNVPSDFPSAHVTPWPDYVSFASGNSTRARLHTLCLQTISSHHPQILPQTCFHLTHPTLLPPPCTKLYHITKAALFLYPWILSHFLSTSSLHLFIIFKTRL